MPMDSEELRVAKKIAEEVNAAGGRTFFVGGYVRDTLMRKSGKDIDLEVHGITPRQLENILDSAGERIEIGKSFGVYNLKGCTLDIAMPRREALIGSGHRDFAVDVDPFIGTEKAAKRRDFTMNALMQDVLTGEIIDHYGGIRDLENGIIRHVSDESFAEDPLRVLRGAQFAARFGFEVASETKELCRGMDLTTLSCERVFEELRKALLKSEKPSVFFEVLRSMNQLSVWFSEVQLLEGINQSKKHHPEGDVWNHTMQVLNEAAKRRENVKNPMGFMLAALVHDFGKIVCTQEINGEIHAYMHETVGLPIVSEFMHRLTNEKALISYVLNLTELHMKPCIMAADNSSVKATNRMFDMAAEPVDLIQLSLADNPASRRNGNEAFLISRLAVFEEYMGRPYVMGKDLIQAGIAPGKYFSSLIEYAHKLRLAGVPKESALKQTLGFAKEKFGIDTKR